MNKKQGMLNLNDEVFLTSAILENNFPKINNDVSMFKLEKLEDEINKIDQSLICFLNINEPEFENKKNHSKYVINILKYLKYFFKTFEKKKVPF